MDRVLVVALSTVVEVIAITVIVRLVVHVREIALFILKTRSFVIKVKWLVSPPLFGVQVLVVVS